MVHSLEKVHSLIQQLGHPLLEKALTDSATPAMDLIPDSAAVIPKGGSKFGGKPDLAPDIEWPFSAPRGKSKVRYAPYQYAVGPQRFIAQINLQDVGKEVWGGAGPRSGLLSFFAACQKHDFPQTGCEPGDWKVIYTQDIEGTVPREPPGFSEEFAGALDESDLPVSDTGLLFPESRMRFQSGYAVQKSLLYGAGNRRHEIHEALFFSKPEHRLGGYPAYLQSPVEEAGTVLLAQFDSDWRGEIEWAGSGRGFFMIDRQALERGAFDEVILFSQQT